MVFGEDFNDVLLHFDTDNEEATRRFRKADCSLMPKKGLYTVRKSGQLRVTFENDSLLRTRTILYKVVAMLDLVCVGGGRGFAE